MDLGLLFHGLSFYAHDPGREEGPAGQGEFVLRRARLRVLANVRPWLTAFLQTERGSGDGAIGLEFRVIDAWVEFHPHPAAKLRVGAHMAPASRQNTTLAMGLMAPDRPSSAFRTLTWGTRALARFANESLLHTDAGLRGVNPVRDHGITFNGVVEPTAGLHLKYYAGLYEGVQKAGSKIPRVTGRLQVNLGDPEPAYFNRATYRGALRTFAMGTSLDWQPHVAPAVNGGSANYTFATVDLFAERRLLGGDLSVEAAWKHLSLGGVRELLPLGAGGPVRDARLSEGHGAFAQVGWHRADWQPWVGWETWRAGVAEGHLDAVRAGVNYYLPGDVVVLKAGWERMWIARAGGTVPLDSVLVGTFVFY